MTESAATQSTFLEITRATGLLLVGILYSVTSHAVSPVIAINDEAKTVDVKPQPLVAGCSCWRDPAATSPFWLPRTRN